ISGTELRLKAGTALDFETKTSYAVTVVVDDDAVGGTPDDSAAHNLAITDINEAPTAAALANAVNALAENTDTGSRIKLADIQITDDAIGTNEISLAGGDAASFEVDGNELFLQAGQVLNFESQVSYDVTVSVEDSSVAGSTPVTVDYTLTITDDNTEPITVSGTKFDDLNGNGQRDSADPSSGSFEPGLADWTIRLYLDDGDGLLETNVDTLVDSTTTDGAGSYSFTDVEPGQYFVAEIQQAGFVQTSPAPLGIHTVAAAGGQNSTSNDFGNFETVAIHGTKYNDVNGNGQRDSADPSNGSFEPGLASWTIHLYLDDGNGLLDPNADTLVDSATTDGSGSYSFTDVGPGQYFVAEVGQNGFVQTAPTNPGTHHVEPSSGQNIDSLNFGNFETVTVSGTKYNDLNGNGQRDSSDPASGSFEPTLAGWTIRLYLDDGNGLLDSNVDTLVDSATTDGSGSYSFTDVGPGQYLVAEVQQNGYVQTFPASPGTHTVTATSGQDVTSQDFGNFGVSRILTVNSTGDGGDVNWGDGVAEDADGNTTLRAAIEEANAVANSADYPDAIFFALPGEGPYTIQPATALPNLKDPVILDATTQAGYSGSPVVELDGSNAGELVSGLKVTGGGSGSTIRGFTVNRFEEHGIFISRKSDVTVEGNYLGTDPTGTQDLGNGEAGVYIINAVNNLVHQNLISGNDLGIFVEGPVSNGNIITGNTIGTNAEGTAALKNRFFNIDIAAGSDNRIGGTAEGEGNLISGSKTGVSIRGTAATGNLLLGNKIGTNADGTAAIRNTRGVKILDADENVIGGAGAAGNLISGNTIGLLFQRGDNNLLEGNYIGTNADGSAAVPNTRGVLIRDSQANQIGGEPNVISGNLREGVKIFGSSTDNVVSGNHIGINAAGDEAVGNDMGVRISGLASANTIGGTAATDRNVISGNVDEGLLLTADNNTISGNFIGIDATGT
ncbi:MAG: SdrD B-like domain-containing protein, partial [Pirellulales bacterium]